MQPMRDTYVYDGIRTPFGRHAGVLAAVRPDDLMGDTIAALLARTILLLTAGS